MRITVPGKPFEIVCKEQSLPEFPGLLFGVSSDNALMYFNASAYLRSIGSDLKIADFLSSYDPLIKAIQQVYSIKDDEVCRLDMEGNYLIEVDFIYLYICFTDHQFAGYITERLNDLFSNGVAVSDSYLWQEARARLSGGTLKQMLDESQKDAE